MRTWIVLLVGVPFFGGCASSTSSKSGVSSECCIVGASGDASTATCWCGSSGDKSGTSYNTKVNGTACETTFVTTLVDGGTEGLTVTGTVPTSASECISDLPL